jgi:nucleotide-binding universal stress UspA family protein
MFQRVVVGVDGSDGGRDAVELARQLLSPTGQVILGNVYSYAGVAGLGGRPSRRDRARPCARVAESMPPRQLARGGDRRLLGRLARPRAA